jgi:hypothetical protein
MSTLRSPTLAMLGTAALALVACTENAPLDPHVASAAQAELSTQMGRNTTVAQYKAITELRRATARYHDVDAALADGFIPVGECEVHEGESPGGIPYARMDYLLDGAIDPARPDALLYEPGRHGRLTLVGVELAVPYPLWTEEEPPEFLGVSFRREDDMGVFGLHIWVWRQNPDGMFAWGNPRVSCEGEA